MHVETNKDSEGEQIMKIFKPESISKDKKKKDRKRNKREQEKTSQAEALTKGEEPQKKVRFDMTKNKVTEFFKHGKVATRVLNKWMKLFLF